MESPDRYEVRGLLTIRGQAKPVMLTLRAAIREEGIWIEGSGRVRLSDFGLKPPRGVLGVRLVIGTKDEMNVLFGLLAASIFVKRVSVIYSPRNSSTGQIRRRAGADQS